MPRGTVTHLPESELAAAELLVAHHEQQAALLRRAISRVSQAHAPDVVTAHCGEALSGPTDGVARPLHAEARSIAHRLHEPWGDPAHALRYLMVGRPFAFGGRTPFEVLKAGEAELLLYSLNALEHGLCA